MKHQIINNDLKKFTIKFNKFLKKKLSKDKNLLNQAILYSINTGGKRFRPYLVYIFGKELNLSNSVFPISDGELAIVIPQSSIFFILSLAPPLPPEIIAPA